MSVRDSGGLREYGNAILSRERLSAQDWARLPHVEGSESRCVVRGRHPVGAEIWVTHLSRMEASERAEQARAIVTTWLRGPRPTVLLGDLNATPDEPAIAILGEVFTDVWGVLRDEPGWTFRTDRPVRRIDYVFVSSGIQAVRADLADVGIASDHQAAVADLLVTAPDVR